MDNLGPDTEVQPGETAVLIGFQGNERILCEETADRIGRSTTKSCALASRVPRIHRACLRPVVR